MPTATKNTRQKKQDAPVQIMPNEAGKLPPQAIELEEAVLGALMLEKDSYAVISEILRPESFYKIEHQRIFQAVQNLAMRQQPIDMLTVKEELAKLGFLEEVGGLPYITTLTSKVSSAAHIEYHARILAQKFLARELIRVSTSIERDAFDDKTDIENLMQEAEAGIFEISQKNQKKDSVPISSVLRDALNQIEQARKAKDGLSGIPTGFSELDAMTSGWQRSDLVIIAARPAMGKTAFVLSMAKNMAVDNEKPVAVFSLEMSNVQLVNRLLMNVTGISGDKIKSGKMTDEEWNILTQKVNEIDDVPIYIDDTPSLSVFEFRTKARRLVREHGVECIIIDYLQLMNANGMSIGSREQEISTISRSLKGMAKELNIPIIALSQLNRGVETRAGNDKRPQLADLRESGAIEQDADIVCFIHRPEYYKIYEDANGNSLRGIAEIIVAKHRSGAVGDVRLRFISENAKFANLNEGSALEFNKLNYKETTTTTGQKGALIEGNEEEFNTSSSGYPF
ncbi:MAG: replicative DNA helicase [Bacteroidales bacterium]|nr:replicative DNA helicase [Bacteroidales bacterium]